MDAQNAKFSAIFKQKKLIFQHFFARVFIFHYFFGNLLINLSSLIHVFPYLS